jgi:hypothetical protein
VNQESVHVQTTAAPGRKLERSRAPVFVIGCHRSGTNLLYDNLLSAGGFAVYRGALPVYKMLIPKFGTFTNAENRVRIMETWLRSKGFRRSGLEAGALAAKVVGECRTGGDFLRTVMDEIAARQNVRRWAVYDPDNVLYIPRIKVEIPEALFVHIIRDGRDIALSLKKMEGFRPLPWGCKTGSLEATALYWEWMVGSGCRHGNRIPADYLEVRYEDLVSAPRLTLATIGKFLEHDLDYDRIQQLALGRLSESNSSFLAEGVQGTKNPVNRWKERLSRQEVASLEALVGDCLKEHGYALSLPESDRRPGLSKSSFRAGYRAFLEAKLWLKLSTPAGRMTNLASLELGPANHEKDVTAARVRRRSA